MKERAILTLELDQIDYLLEVLQLPHSEDDTYLQEIVHSIHEQVYL